MITETVYLGSDNVNSIELRANGTAQAINSCTRMRLKIGDKTIDSSLITGVFDWTTNGASGQLDLTLGFQDLRKGLQRGTLVIYDATYPRGLVWGDLMFNVKEV